MHKRRRNIGICGSRLYDQQPIQFINALREEGRKYHYYFTALSCAFDEVPNEEEEAGGENCICARFGGDEFICVLLRECPENILKEYFFHRINQILEKKEGVSEKPYSITASIGMSRDIICPRINLEAMIAEADREMYRMKNRR